MIPVKPQPEPDSFEDAVRTPGREFLRVKKLLPTRKTTRKQVPDKFKFRDYWLKVLPELHSAYGGICAFSGVFIPPVVGAKTVEHFKPKSLYPGLAYEWSNYRLVCSALNGRKSDNDDVLDPFELKAGTFRIGFADGRIFPNPKLSGAARAAAQATIDRLKLDDPECRELRLLYFNDYIRNRDADVFKTRSPFVWSEARRQKLL